jgi:hypothetical protein
MSLIKMVGEEAFHPDDEDRDTPAEIEIGRALAIARLGCLPERIGLGLQLLIGTVQRRRAVTGANRWRFRTYREANDEVAWYVPPFFRKSGTKRGKRSHLVPCLGFAAIAQERLDRLSDSRRAGCYRPLRTLVPTGRTPRPACSTITCRRCQVSTSRRTARATRSPRTASGISASSLVKASSSWTTWKASSRTTSQASSTHRIQAWLALRDL